ncbi:MAG: 50S ribosomal protein L21 [Candidatus Melainabacteria bacterium]|nr:50S ribosomal protein L21 [Candidatus Melainabacteria bacterium]
MYAIVEASGRQYQLEAGRFVDIDLVSEPVGQTLVFEQVLMIVNGQESHLGQPYVDGAKVMGHVLSHGKERKIIVYKQRPKKGTRKKQGHREQYTRIFVDSIQLKGEMLAEAKKAEKLVVKEPASPKPEKKAKVAPPPATVKKTASSTAAKAAVKPKEKTSAKTTAKSSPGKSKTNKTK